MPRSYSMPTVGEIARRTGQPVHRVEYVIRARKIQPSGRAGNCRVFSEESVEQIAAEIRAVDARKESAKGDRKAVTK